MSPPEQLFTDEQLKSDSVSKKDLVVWLQQFASFKFLAEHKLKGALNNVVKTKTKDALIADYKLVIETQSFRAEGEVDETGPASKATAPSESKAAGGAVEALTQKAAQLSVADKEKERPKYTKRIIKKGDKNRMPSKGDTVKCYYTGKLQDGTVFDTNAKQKSKTPPLAFKVGQGKVIRGWDEALLTMCLNEVAELVIEPEWAYGKKGLEGKIPPNSTLVFEVELVGIE